MDLSEDTEEVEVGHSLQSGWGTMVAVAVD